MIAYMVNGRAYVVTARGVARVREIRGFRADSFSHGVLMGRCDENKIHDSLGRFAPNAGGGEPNICASARGRNVLAVRDFKNRRVARAHYGKHVRRFKEYPDDETYLRTALELAEQPVGGDIAGYRRRDRQSYVRYNRRTKDYVIARAGKGGGIVTLFKAKEGMAYFEWRKRRDERE